MAVKGGELAGKVPINSRLAYQIVGNSIYQFPPSLSKSHQNRIKNRLIVKIIEKADQ